MTEKDKFAFGTVSWTGLFWILLVFVIHFFDLFIRYKGGAANWYVWTLFFVIYSIIALRFNQVFKDKKVIIVFWALSAIAMPIFYPLASKIPVLGGAFGAMILAFNPVWVIYLLFFHNEKFPRLSLAYITFWLILLSLSLMPQMQSYAAEQGYGIPTYSPAVAISYFGSAVYKAYYSFWAALEGVQEAFTREMKRTAKMVSGDYYTGEVDEGAKKKLGVFLEPLKSSQPTFYEGEPVTIYTTLKAETIAEPIDIKIKCTADKNNIGTVIPKGNFSVDTYEEQSIDCVFEDLKKKNYNFKITADFSFVTRAYQLAYTMDQTRLRESRRRNEDPLKGFPDRNPKTIYTSGPIMIGMNLGTQPIGVPEPSEDAETTGPTLGVTVDNVWTGKMTKIKHLIIMTPKGIEIKDINGIPVEKVGSCQHLMKDFDVKACNDTVDNAYLLPSQELLRVNAEKDIMAYTFRAHTTITDYSKLVSANPLPKNFKVTVKYDYEYSVMRAINVDVREAKP